MKSVLAAAKIYIELTNSIFMWEKKGYGRLFANLLLEFILLKYTFNYSKHFVKIHMNFYFKQP